MTMKIIFLLLLGIVIFPSPSSTQLETDYVEALSPPPATILGLSPWELFVLSDLIFRLTENQCPNINYDVMTSFKEQLNEVLKTVPRTDAQNDDFLPAYNDLVQCVDHLMGKQEEVVVEVNHSQNDKVVEATPPTSSEEEWNLPTSTTPPKEETTTSKTPGGVEKEEETDDFLTTISKFLWNNLSPIRILMTPFSSTLEPEVEEKVLERRKMRTDGGDPKRSNKHLVVFHKARQSIANFFHEQTKLVQKACPAKHKPDKVFMRQAFMDMTTWMTVEHHSAIMIANQFFEKQKLLQEIQDCNMNKVSSSPKK